MCVGFFVANCMDVTSGRWCSMFRAYILLKSLIDISDFVMLHTSNMIVIPVLRKRTSVYHKTKETVIRIATISQENSCMPQNIKCYKLLTWCLSYKCYKGRHIVYIHVRSKKGLFGVLNHDLSSFILPLKDHFIFWKFHSCFLCHVYFILWMASYLMHEKIRTFIWKT